MGGFFSKKGGEVAVCGGEDGRQRRMKGSILLNLIDFFHSFYFMQGQAWTIMNVAEHC